jgi:hypothetical protein
VWEDVEVVQRNPLLDAHRNSWVNLASQVGQVSI